LNNSLEVDLFNLNIPTASLSSQCKWIGITYDIWEKVIPEKGVSLYNDYRKYKEEKIANQKE